MTSDSMRINRCILILSATFAVSLLAAPAQQPQPALPSPSDSIKLTVVVNSKSGQPVSNLSQQDFTILDNKTPRPITSFRVMTPAQEPVEVILFIDAVNTPYQMVAYMRQYVGKFLQANEGKLAYPTAIAILTDQGVQIDSGFSTDGNALNDSLAHHTIGLRTITSSSQWGGLERLQICLNAFHQLLTAVSTLPGRKIVLWISPGWPLISGPEIFFTAKQMQGMFSSVVSFSTQMRQDNVTLYNINPVGTGQSLETADYYQAFLKGVAKTNDVRFGNLGVQVLAVQSGGLAIESDNDVTGNIQKCLTDVQSWYEITFDPLPADKPNESHQIQIKLDKPGLVARTRTGYYANPRSSNPDTNPQPVSTLVSPVSLPEVVWHPRPHCFPNPSTSFVPLFPCSLVPSFPCSLVPCLSHLHLKIRERHRKRRHEPRQQNPHRRHHLIPAPSLAAYSRASHRWPQ